MQISYKCKKLYAKLTVYHETITLNENLLTIVKVFFC